MFCYILYNYKFTTFRERVGLLFGAIGYFLYLCAVIGGVDVVENGSMAFRHALGVRKINK